MEYSYVETGCVSYVKHLSGLSDGAVSYVKCMEYRF